jgi:CRP/FNR family transcriptional regulator
VDVVDILLRAPVFGEVGRADLEPLVPHLRHRRFDRGQSVWVEGDPADALWVVAQGQLKSHRVNRDGGEVILGFSSAVDVMGEVGLFHPSGRRQVSVTAMEPSRCLTLARAPLVAFLAEHPVAMERMLERISAIAVRAAYSFSGVAFADIRRRVAGALLTLCDEFGEETGDGTRIRLRLSQGTLAALVAASRENVNRALSSLVASGVVSQRDGRFHVHDVDALRDVSGLADL